jgi:hypothetical protein
MSDDPELEAFLKQFRPRPPAPLRRPSGHGLPPWRFIALAAGLLGVAVALYQERKPGGEPPMRNSTLGVPLPTVGVLGAALRSGRYEAVLDEMSSRALPNPLRPGGALSGLGDINRDR